MYVSNLKNMDVAAERLSKNLEDCQIEQCSFGGFKASGVCWKAVSIKDCNVPDIGFVKASISDCLFARSNLQESTFTGCLLSNSEYSGLTLIKACFENCRIAGTKIVMSSMQRAVINGCAVKNTSFRDFEGIYGRIEKCVFLNCRFELSSGQYMNGFADATITDCIFIGCDFKGFPLRGANVSSCVFLNCYGEISDSLDFKNTYYARMRGISKMPLTNRGQAENLLRMEADMGNVEQIRSYMEGMDAATVKDALAMLLSEREQVTDTSKGLADEIDEKKFRNFAQAVNYLKEHYKFQELVKFSTEADLVYVDTDERKVLLTDMQEKPPVVVQETVPAPEQKGGRFGNLEL